MDTALLVIRVLIAVVFGISGIMKLFDLSGSVSAAENFGVPQRLSRLVGHGLPIVEIAIALGLLFRPTASFAGAIGTVLMGAFIVVILRMLIRGERPDCHCFGKVHAAPIGWHTLARNSAIGLGIATVAIAGPGASLVDRWDQFDGASPVLLALLLVAVAIIGWQWIGLRDLSRIATGLHDRVVVIERLVSGDSPSEVPGPGVGTAAPGFLLQSVSGSLISLENLRALGKPTLLVFTEPTCSVCTTMMPKLARWTHDLAHELTVAVVSTGSEDDNRKKAERYGLEWVLLQERREVTMAYRVPGTPAAVLIDQNGMVAAPLAYGPEKILGLLTQLADVAMAAAPVTRDSRSTHQAPIPPQLHPAGSTN